MSFLNSYRFGAASPGFSFNNALLFDGVDDYVNFTRITTGSPSVYSFSSWFNSVDIQTSNTPIISSNNLNSFIRCQGSLNRVFWRTPTTNLFFTFTGIFTNNAWHHIAGFVTGGFARVFVDGTESVTGALAYPPHGLSTQQWSVVGMDNGGAYMNGKMDETGLWYGYALTPTDVATLYNSGNGANCTDVSPANLHFNYHFDESGTATTAVDSSSAGNNGTLNNFPTSGMWVPH